MPPWTAVYPHDGYPRKIYVYPRSLPNIEGWEAYYYYGLLAIPVSRLIQYLTLEFVTESALIFIALS